MAEPEIFLLSSTRCRVSIPKKYKQVNFSKNYTHTGTKKSITV